MKNDIRLYRIVGSDDYGFYACKRPDGEQLLFGIQLPEVVVLHFDERGVLRYVDARPVRTATSDPYAPELENELEEVKRELGWSPSAIDVAEFYLPDRWIGVRQLPDHYQEVIDHPERFTADRRDVLENDIRQWLDRGDFVLYWTEDYYLDRDGEVVSS